MDTEELRKLLDEATPGPWVVVTDESAAQVKGYPCIYANDYTIVGTEGMYGEIEKDFSNARLIALAPTLARKVIAAEKLVEAMQVARDNEDIEGMFFALAAWEAAQ